MIRWPTFLKAPGRPGEVASRAHVPPRLPPHRRKILFESLEPRLLLSADIAPEVAANLQDGLQQFKDWAGALTSYQQLGQQLPVVSTALGSAADLSGWLQTRLVDPVQLYLSGGGTKTTDGLVSALAGVAGLSAVSGDQYGNSNTILSQATNWPREICRSTTRKVPKISNPPITRVLNPTAFQKNTFKILKCFFR